MIFKFYTIIEFKIWNMKGLRHRFAKIKGGANQSLWQKLLSKMFIFLLPLEWTIFECSEIFRFLCKQRGKKKTCHGLYLFSLSNKLVSDQTKTNLI